MFFIGNARPLEVTDKKILKFGYNNGTTMSLDKHTMIDRYHCQFSIFAGVLGVNQIS